MSSIGSGYDLSSTTYSPEGRIFQTEYASKAVDNSGTAIAIQCKDGVVMGVEKLLLSKLLVPGCSRRVMAVDKHAGVAIAGLLPDGRQVANRAASEAAQYKRFYGSPIPLKVLAERVARYVHLFTLYWWTRPCGCALLLAGCDEDGAQVYVVETSGVVSKYFGAAIGKGRQAAKTELEKLPLLQMSCRDAVKAVAKIIYGVHDDTKDKPFEMEMSWACKESNMQFVKVPADLMDEAKAAALAALEEDMDAS